MANGEEPKRNKHVALAVVLVSILFMLAIAEIAVRLQGRAPELARLSVGRYQWSPNPELGYEPAPPTPGTTATGDRFDPNWRFNRLGFRDRDHALAPEPGVFRIVVIGDSIAEGFGVDDDSAIFSALLEKNMGEAGREIEVVNLAVSGYNTQQEVAMLVKRGLAFQPDLVLLQYSPNDTGPGDGGLIEKLRKAEETGDVTDQTLMNPFLRWSALYRLLFVGLMREDLQNQRDQNLTQLTTNTVSASFARLAELSREQDFQVFVVVFPFLEGAAYRQFMGVNPLVREYSAEHGFMHLDVAPALARCRRSGESLAVDFLHPNELGHRCAADAITRSLLDQGIPN